MPLKLNTASSGSVTLDAANTASNFTVTIPAVTATMLNNQSDITAQVKTATSASGNAPIYSCRAWVNFNGTGTVAIRASGNVSSITDNAVGDYTVNFTTAMPDANYSAMGSAGTTSALDFYQQYWVYQKDTETRTASLVRMVVVQHGAISGWTPQPADVSQVNIAIFC